MSQPPEIPKRRNAGFFSRASVFTLPVGSFVEAAAVSGYYIDLRVKAGAPRWPDPELEGDPRFIAVGQWGLGAYERHLHGEAGPWLEAALAAGRDVVAAQREDGGLPEPELRPHTFPVEPPWLSAMAQGQCASLLVRLFRETGDSAFAETALRALEPMRQPVSEGGVAAPLGGGWWPEEYPSRPHSYVLNGGIFALWGIRDVAVGLGDEAAAALFEEGLATLAAEIERWDTGYWSRYDLFPHPLVNVASSSYHVLHVHQLEALTLIAPRPELAEAARRWRGYLDSPANARRAFASKAVFRLLVPRNRLLAGRLPWLRHGRRGKTGEGDARN
jgi:heparosan-N-sulfate-glucuronate 5-epimerase